MASGEICAAQGSRVARGIRSCLLLPPMTHPLDNISILAYRIWSSKSWFLFATCAPHIQFLSLGESSENRRSQCQGGITMMANAVDGSVDSHTTCNSGPNFGLPV